MAAVRGDEEAINLLLDAGIGINLSGDMGCTPLHYALSLKHYGAAKLLVERGAAQNIKDEFGREAYAMWPDQYMDSEV